MKKQILFSFFAASLMLTSCSSDRDYSEDIKPDPDEIVSESPIFNASFDDETRASLDNKDVLWNEGDKLNIFLKRFTPDNYVLAKGAGTASGLFNPVSTVEAHPAEIGKYVAYYGESIGLNLTLNLDVLCLNGVKFPENQTFIPKDEKHSENSVDYSNAPMIAISDNTNLMFSNLAGLLKLKFKNTDASEDMTVGKIVVRDLDNNGCAGVCTIDNRVDYGVTVKQKGVSATLNVTPNIKLNKEPEEFYIMLIPMIYRKGLSIEIQDPNGSVIRLIKTKPCQVKRSEILNMPELDLSTYNMVAVDPATHTVACKLPGFLTIDNIKKAVGNGTELKITGPINGNDIEVIKEAIGCNLYDSAATPIVTSLDLSGADIENNTIPDEMFLNAKISSVKLPVSTTHIGMGIMVDSKIKRISIPANVTTLSESCFNYAYDLEEITFEGNKITAFPSSLFESCTSLKTIKIPASVKTLGASCFLNSGLETLELPVTLEKVEQNVVKGCNNLKKLILACNRNCFDDYYNIAEAEHDFSNCELRINESFYDEADFYLNKYLGYTWKSINNLKGIPFIVIDKSTNTLKCGEPGLMELDNSSICIDQALNGGGTFRYEGPMYCCDLVKVLTFNILDLDLSKADIILSKKSSQNTCNAGSYTIDLNKDHSIPSYVFSNKAVKNIILPDNLERIEPYAFANITSYDMYATSIKIPASVTYIGENILQGSRPDTIHIECPKSSVNMNNNAFSNMKANDGDLYLHPSYRDDVTNGHTFMGVTWNKIIFKASSGVGIGGINDEDVF